MNDENSGDDIQIIYNQLYKEFTDLHTRYMRLKKLIPDISQSPTTNYLGLLDVKHKDISGKWQILPPYIQSETAKSS